ncbi:isochorismatase family protein [Phaeobacter inhibens]|uniref:isochorismatase family protein n=1 Tax=Phaeobacter inhibens TaxID=221822 RepID=UPI0021A6C41A|nr:isochorismatase family protein [Phaeobacter inhibens]UWR62771.1 isochorismatase family protein [Phaeobacter inhibens]
MKALLIIDMQNEMQRRIDAGMDCVNADAPDRIEVLSSFFREQGFPVVHVRHSDHNPASPLHEGAETHLPMPCAAALNGEAVFFKSTSSAFVSTGLADYLQSQGITDLLVVGAVAGFCVNTTVRGASDLGFAVTVAEDAVIGFSLPGSDHSAQVIFDVTMAHIKCDFAKIVDTDEILRSYKQESEIGDLV